MIPGLGYLRVSGKSQAGPDRDGFERQAVAIDSYAKANGIEVTAYYFEPGVSGTTAGEDRLGWVAMMAALQSNGTRIAIVEKLDRLARDLMVQEHIIVDVKARGVDLRSTCEPDLCGTDPTRVLMRHIIGAICQYDKCMIVLKLAAAKQRKRDRGERCEGILPYGSKPNEAETLTEMKSRRESGQTLQVITDYLNSVNAPTRHAGRTWHVGQVGRILARAQSS